MIDRLISLLFFAGLGLLAFILLILVAATAWWAYQHLPQLDLRNWKRSFPGRGRGTAPRARSLQGKQAEYTSDPFFPGITSEIPPSAERDRFTARQIAASIEEDRRTQLRFMIVVVVSACLLLALLFLLLP